ncbi:SERTA domain-containing protein 3 [Marasmius crinis-equi]|uniref:SERTA domain-containing protein 3 n=1 Tax=Marasmius crinis-equi TaxID=585013 RepID=A0ABR3EZM2_9AGAR
MPSQRTFTGQRADFLRSKGAAYAKARLQGTVKDEVAVIQRQFLNRWPVDLPLDVELAQEVLDAVDDDKAAPERPDPESLKDELSADEYQKAVDGYKEYKVTLAKRKRQIEDRLKSNYDKDNASTMKMGDKHPFSALLAQLSEGKDAKQGKPRKNSAAQEWGAANKAFIDAKLQERKKANKTKQTSVPMLYNEVLRDEFKKLSEAEQKEWAEKATSNHAAATTAWKERMNAPPSQKPEDRQACINRLGDFCKPILEGICERTGMIATLVIGGPEPQDGGRINALAIHSGDLTSGAVPMDWGRSEVQIWKQHIFPSFTRHLKKTFSMEECKSRALKAEDGGVDGDGGEDGVGDGVGDFTRWREQEGSSDGQSDSQMEKGKQAKGGEENDGKGKDKVKGKQKAKPRRRDRETEETAGDSSDNDLEGDESSADVKVTRSSPPRTRNRAGDTKSTTPLPAVSESVKSAASVTKTPPRAPSPVPDSSFAIPSLPPSSVPAITTHETPTTPSPPGSPLRSPQNAGSPVPDWSGTSPVPVHNSPPTSRDPRACTPSPVIQTRSPSPLGEPAKVSSSKRKAPDALVSQNDGKQLKHRAASSIPTPAATKEAKPAAKKRKAEVANPVEGEGAVDNEEESTLFPKLPENVGNGRNDFYAAQALKLFRRPEALQLENWLDVVRKWLVFERREGFEGKKLATRGRPTWVTDWVGRGCNPTYLPEHHDAHKVVKEWWGWWKELQPKWRKFSERDRPLVSYPQTGSWDAISIGGSNGLTNVIATLVFAAVRLSKAPSSSTGRAKQDRENARKDLQDALNDVSLVLDGVLGSE